RRSRGWGKGDRVVLWALTVEFSLVSVSWKIPTDAKVTDGIRTLRANGSVISHRRGCFRTVVSYFLQPMIHRPRTPKTTLIPNSPTVPRGLRPPETVRTKLRMARRIRASGA